MSLTANRRVDVLDYLRVPYSISATVAGDELLTYVETGPARVCWPSEAGFALQADRSAGRWTLGEIALFGRLLDDQAAVEALGPGWDPVETIRDSESVIAGSVRRHADGSVFIPFDPDEMTHNLWSEGYLAFARSSAAGTLLRFARQVYYRVRPLMPRRLQLALRRSIAPLQGRTAFPSWPVESSLHDLLDLILELIGSTAGQPVPWIAPWPCPYTWAVVLTHDVETATGYEHRHLLRDIEIAEGFRSSWNLVPRRYVVEDSVVAELMGDGFEIGVHGLFHDGRDLESAATLQRRLPEIRAWAERWSAVGFRAPATHRVWEWMPTLGFDYDSSYPDTDPYEPVSGGCCSWLPYRNEGMVELPITLPQDHTLFEILSLEAFELWKSKADAIRERSGMALLITHPDYMVDPERLDDYRRFLAYVGAKPGVWRALPREVSAWWRRRAESTLVWSDRCWRVDGPAGNEAQVSYGPMRGALS